MPRPILVLALAAAMLGGTVVGFTAPALADKVTATGTRIDP